MLVPFDDNHADAKMFQNPFIYQKGFETFSVLHSKHSKPFLEQVSLQQARTPAAVFVYFF